MIYHVLPIIGVLLSGHFVASDVAVFDFSPYSECTEEKRIDLPKLGSKFTIQAELKVITDTGELLSVDSIDGYVDTDAQCGTNVANFNGVKMTYLYDFQKGDAYTITDNLTCFSTNLSDNGCNPYAVFLADLNAQQTTSVKAAGLCNFTMGPMTYMGDDTARSIPVRKWKQCVYDGQHNVVSVSYYYSAKDDDGPGNKDMPVRFEYKVLNGTGVNGSATFTYDFTLYKDSVDDTAIFLPPAGAYCASWVRENKPVPALFDQFTLSMMTVSQNAKEVHNMRMYFDQKKQQVAFFTDSISGTRFPPSNERFSGGVYYSTIHDFASGLAFVKTAHWYNDAHPNCTVSSIDNNAIDSQDPNEVNSTTIRIRNVNQLFDMNQPGWVYVGERDFNKVRCYVWSRQQTTDTLIRVTEIYWMKEEWTVRNVSAFFGMIRYRRSLNGTMIEIFRNSVTDYDFLPSFSNRYFDVSSCLRTTHPILVTFSIKVQNYTAVSPNFRSFSAGVRDALSTILSTSTLRFADMELTAGSNATDNLPVFWFTLLEWTNVTGRPDAPVQRPSQAVVDDLRSRMADGNLDITVQYNNKSEIVTLVSGTLHAGADLVKPSSVSSTTHGPMHTDTAASLTAETAAVTGQSTGYTSGDMAGLAFAMIIIFGVAGLAAGFFFHKRTVAIPYHQDQNI